MNKQTLRRIGWVGASLGLTSVLVGCKDMAADSVVEDATSSSGYLATDNGLASLNGFGGCNGLYAANGLTAVNGLNMQNGLAAQNGLTGVNGLASINGLVGVNGFQGTNGFTTVNGFMAQNGLASINGLNLSNGLVSTNGLGETHGLMTSDGGRMVVKYLAKCALAANDTLVKHDQSGNAYTFAGGLGLAPGWKDASTGSCGQDCSEQMSACMMAHINTSGVHIPLWMVGPESSVGWGTSPSYPTREGTFFGQMMVVNGQNNLDAYYCNGPGTDANVVPGRIGSTQGNVPYANPYAAANMDGMCDTAHVVGGTDHGSCTAHTYNTSTGVAGCTLGTSNCVEDGPSDCTLNGHKYNFPLTVWRGQTFQAESATYTAPVGVQSCTPATNCGGGKRVSWIRVGTGITLHNVNVAVGGTNDLVVYYTNGDPVGSPTRTLDISVNGGATQSRNFQATGSSWNTVVGITITLSGFNAGSNNTIYMGGNSVNQAPDLDWIEVLNSTTTTTTQTTPGTCTKANWGETASINATGVYGPASKGDDGDLTTRYSTQRPMVVGDYYQVDFTGLVYLTGITLDNSQTSGSDYAAKYDVSGSMDGSSWSKLGATTNGGTTTTISFPKTQTRYIRVSVNTANANSGLYWSIGEFNANGCSLN